MKLCFQATKLMELFMPITKVIYRVFLRFQKLHFLGGSKQAFLGSLLKLSTETLFFQHSLLTITFSFAVKKSNIKVNLKVNFGGFQRGIFGIFVDTCNRNIVHLAFFENDNIFFGSEEKSNIGDAKMHFWGFQKGIFWILVDNCIRNIVF